jgi:hypothetical protein
MLRMRTMRLDESNRETHMDAGAKFAAPAIVFLLTLASGVWLSRSGKPLNTAIFTVHKLIALGAVIATAIQTTNALKSAEARATPIAGLILIGLCVVALFASGALMSMNKPSYRALLTIHRIALVMAPLAGAATIYLRTGGS